MVSLLGLAAGMAAPVPLAVGKRLSLGRGGGGRVRAGTAGPARQEGMAGMRWLAAWCAIVPAVGCGGMGQAGRAGWKQASQKGGSN